MAVTVSVIVLVVVAVVVVPPEAAAARSLLVADSISATTGGVTAAKRPAFSRNRRRSASVAVRFAASSDMSVPHTCRRNYLATLPCNLLGHQRSGKAISSACPVLSRTMKQASFAHQSSRAGIYGYAPRFVAIGGRALLHFRRLLCGSIPAIPRCRSANQIFGTLRRHDPAAGCSAFRGNFRTFRLSATTCVEPAPRSVATSREARTKQKLGWVVSSRACGRSWSRPEEES